MNKRTNGRVGLTCVLCALLVCAVLLTACATPEAPGIHRRDRDSWPDTSAPQLRDALLPCAGATALLVAGVALVVGISAARRRH